jgi:hypothetical protein
LCGYESPEGKRALIGTGSPGLGQSPDAVVDLMICRTDDRETAEFWRTEFSRRQAPAEQRKRA